MKLKNWAVAIFMGRVTPFICKGCKRPLHFRDEYAYKYTTDGTVILHNKEKCYELWHIKQHKTV